jgi:hypothetical protein
MDTEKFDALLKNSGIDELPDIWCLPGESFYMGDDRGIYREYPPLHVAHALALLGLSSKRNGESLSAVEAMMFRIRREHGIVAATQMGGYPQGIIEDGLDRMLSTHPFHLMKPHARRWAVLRRLLTNLLGSDPKQLIAFHAWIKVAYGDLLEVQNKASKRRCRPGQAGVFAGPVNSGKSLLTEVLAKIFGDQVGHPYSFMTGATQFNDDTAKAYLQVMDDEASTKNPAARARFGSMIKQFTVVNRHRIAKKYQSPTEMSLRNRLIICLNDDAESLGVLPPMTRSIMDKIMLFRVEKCEMPMPTETREQQEALMNTLENELPGYLHYLLEEFEIPEEMRESRFGVAAYHHPTLKEMLAENDTPHQVLELIDAAFETGALGLKISAAIPGSWVGLARELRAILRDEHGHAEVATLLPFKESLGITLSKLAEEYPGRVRKLPPSGGYQRWAVSRPDKVEVV